MLLLESNLYSLITISSILLIFMLQQKRDFSLLDYLVLEEFFPLSGLLNKLHQFDVLVGLGEGFLVQGTLLLHKAMDTLFAESVAACQDHGVESVITPCLERVVANRAEIFSVLLSYGDLLSYFVNLLLLLSLGRTSGFLRRSRGWILCERIIWFCESVHCLERWSGGLVIE